MKLPDELVERAAKAIEGWEPDYSEALARAALEAALSEGEMVELHAPILVPDRFNPKEDVVIAAGRYLVIPLDSKE